MGNESNKKVLSVYLEEYKTTHARLLTRANHHQNDINFSVVLIIALFAFLGAIYKDNIKINSFILLVLPFPFYSLFLHYLYVAIKIDQYQNYIEALSEKIREICQVENNILNLDGFLKGNDKGLIKFFNKTSNILILVGFFLLPPIVILFVQNDIGAVNSFNLFRQILIVVHIIIIAFGCFFSLYFNFKLR